MAWGRKRFSIPTWFVILGKRDSRHHQEMGVFGGGLPCLGSPAGIQKQEEKTHLVPWKLVLLGSLLVSGTVWLLMEAQEMDHRNLFI